MADRLDDLGVLNYFETEMKGFIVARLSGIKDWWSACIPPEIREDASRRRDSAKKINDVLNKPEYGLVDYLNFDSYERIISRRDNWRSYFEKIFLDKPIFEHKMRVILSLRNDLMHGRSLDSINSTRLRLHCYDILSQVCEAEASDAKKHHSMIKKLGLGTGEKTPHT